MINANLGQFLNTGWFNEATLFYKGYIYWCEGCFDSKKENPIHFFVYKFPAKQVDATHFERLHSNEPFKYEFETWGKSKEEVKQEFLQAKIFDGKSFWEVEGDLAWLDE